MALRASSHVRMISESKKHPIFMQGFTQVLPAPKQGHFPKLEDSPTNFIKTLQLNQEAMTNPTATQLGNGQD